METTLQSKKDSANEQLLDEGVPQLEVPRILTCSFQCWVIWKQEPLSSCLCGLLWSLSRLRVLRCCLRSSLYQASEWRCSNCFFLFLLWMQTGFHWRLQLWWETVVESRDFWECVQSSGAGIKHPLVFWISQLFIPQIIKVVKQRHKFIIIVITSGDLTSRNKPVLLKIKSLCFFKAIAGIGVMTAAVIRALDWGWFCRTGSLRWSLLNRVSPRHQVMKFFKTWFLNISNWVPFSR